MFKLPNSGVIQIFGADAEKVVNNLCTNDLKKLAAGSCCEAFITNVRGWCVEHGFVLKLHNEILLVGQFGNPAALCSHIDRYIVREDAKITDQSELKCVFLLSKLEAEKCSAHFALPTLAPKSGSILTAEVSSIGFVTASCHLLADGDVLLIAGASDAQAIVDALALADVSVETAEEFERHRIASFWPLWGREILEKSIPQELDRDSSAISFTKGCYLGQETIARLDAIGQLQKKLCLLRIETLQLIPPNTPLLKGEQQVGHVTSVAHQSSGEYQLALAYLRRGNFEAGIELTCNGAVAVIQKT